MLLASLCSPFPPVANRVDLPVSSPVEFWVAVPSSLRPLLTECIQISLSNIRSSYVKNKSKQASKGRNEEGCCTQRLRPTLSNGPVLRRCGGFDYCFYSSFSSSHWLPETPCTNKMGPAFWSKSQSQTWSLISGGLALLLLPLLCSS